jgi:hypothetical protein
MSFRNTVAAVALAASAGLAMVAVAQPAAATTASPAYVCGYNGGTEAYWYNCDTVPHRVHVDVYGSNGLNICVDANTVRDLGWSGADWGGVIGAEQIGRCPS